MTNTHHTPGPWTTCRLAPDSDQQARLLVVSSDGATPICGVVTHQADAHLLAAAPELLAVAQLALAYLDGQEYLQACAVLAKARGDQPARAS